MYLTYILPQTWSPKPLGVQGVYMDFATTVHPLPTLRRALALYTDPPHAQNTPTVLFLLPRTALSLSLLLTFSRSSPDVGGGGPRVTQPTLMRTAHERGMRAACSGPTPCGPRGTRLCCLGACESLRMCVHLVPLLTSLTCIK